MRRFVRAHPVVCYYVLALAIVSAVTLANYAYGLAWQARTGHRYGFNEGLWALLTQFGHGRMYANIVSIGWSAAHAPIYFGVFVFGGAPTISAVVISAAGWGWDGLKRLFGRLKPWASPAFRGDALVLYAVLAAVGFALVLFHLAVIWHFKGAAAAASAASIWGLPGLMLPIPFLVGGLIDEGGTLEELGWRGFALPLMLEKTKTPLVAALVLGVLWWAWHFPREVPDIVDGRTDWAAFIPGQAMFLVLVVCMNITMTYAFHRTGSVLPTILIHGWGNFATKAVGDYDVLPQDDRFWMFLIAAVLLVLLAGPQLGRRGYERRRALADGGEMPAVEASPA